MDGGQWIAMLDQTCQPEHWRFQHWWTQSYRQNGKW